MSDKRTVATDALETLGTIIDRTQKRDAIHLAVEPVEAGESVEPGDDITVIDGKAYRADPGDDNPPLGIVDPFLKQRVKKGQRFWFVMYPRMVTSLRHVWAHPAFPDELVKIQQPETIESLGRQVFNNMPSVKEETDRRQEAVAWLMNWADDHGLSYDNMMSHVAVDSGYLNFGSEDSGSIEPEFWDHAEIVLRKKLNNKLAYFSCSC